MISVHTLKAWPEPFSALVEGRKRFEYRRDDRDPPFDVGDILILKEWYPEGGLLGRGEGYSGVLAIAHIDYLVRGPKFGIPEGYVVMSICDVAVYPKKD